MNKRSIILFTLFLLLMSSCRMSRYVPEGQYLFNKVSINSDLANVGKDELGLYYKQIPNPGIFDLFRLQLSIYNLSGKDTTKWINRTLRKMGEPPVIFDSLVTNNTKLEMKRFLSNVGFMDATVDVLLEYPEEKKVNVTYKVVGNEPYLINKISYDIQDDSIRAYILADTANCIINDYAKFNVDILELERQRIVKLLKQEGFYYFNKDYIYYEADSSVTSHQIDVVMKTRPMLQTRADGTTEKVPHKRLKIRTVSMLPWFDGNKTIPEQMNDTVYYGGYIFFYENDRMLRPKLLADNIFIIPGTSYDEKDVEKTYAALSRLGISRFVNIMFQERENNTLDCFILMSPNKLQGFTVEAEGTNSDGDLGGAVNLTYMHRNIFRGSELLRFKVRGAYENLGEITDALSNNSLEFGAEASITYPNFLFPFVGENIRRRVRANTEFSVVYTNQERPEFVRSVAGGGLKYNWSTGTNENERYRFELFDLSYVDLPSKSKAFEANYLADSASSILKYSYLPHFILRTGFSFSKNFQQQIKPNTSYLSYRGGVEFAGNTLSGLMGLLNVEKKDSVYKIANIRYSQYAKGEVEFAYNRIMDKRNRFVYRAFLGVAYPYGNSEVLPFEKRYFSGGANSVRGWSVRSLGPGVYTKDRVDFFNQSGDIKIDLNFEYRFKLFWILEGAAFVDGGNIWTIRSYDDQQGGFFEFSKFYNQMAYAYGLGLRFDFSFFLLRVDMGVKLFDPSQARKDRIRFPVEAGDAAFHFAIGYPF